ncbi:MFS general substrate transporter [Paxillus ammoniavirescens]|nr:MFS general substrate transporter [Paxillus ammoniavirescens]
MSERSSDSHQGQLDSGETYGSEERPEGCVAPTLTAAQEIKLWRKIDLRLMSIISLICLFSSMDRSNIGNAKLDGLITQLDLTGNKYNIALMMSSIPNALFEFPSNLAIRVIRPSKWLPGILGISGLVMMLMGFVKTYPQLVGVRICLGTTGAGTLAGVAYYTTLWYPNYMLQYHVALFSGASGLAGAFSGLLAYAIGFMSGDGRLEGWSWIFILEGVATIIVALIATFVMVDYPSTAKFLTAEERSFVIARRLEGRDEARDEEHDMSQQVWAAFTDWQVWALAVVQLSCSVPLNAITYFLPTIINNFGYSTSLSQLLTVPPYACATVTVLVFAHFSDKVKLRSPFIFAAQWIALLGYIINIIDAPVGVKYFGTYLCVIGSFSSGPGSISWSVVLRSFNHSYMHLPSLTATTDVGRLANNLQGKSKRAVGMALQLSVGSLGGVIGSNVYHTKDAPRYLLGHGLVIMFISIGLVVIPVIVLALARINARKDHEELVEKQQGQKSDLKMGDRFRYTL